MFGPFYVDFGPLAPVFCFLLGGFISFTRRRVLQGDVAALPLYITFVMQIAAAIVVNAFLAAYGIFFNLAFIFFWIGVTMLRPQIRQETCLERAGGEAMTAGPKPHRLAYIDSSEASRPCWWC